MLTTGRSASRHDNGAPKRLMAMLAAFLLLAMQALVLQHQLDLDSHNDGEPCELCLHLVPLDHGLVSSLTLPSTPVFSQPPVPPALPETLSQHHTVYHSRGPPSPF